MNHAMSFLDGYLRFFRDHFAFRDTLIEGLAAVKVKEFGNSTNPLVVIGQDGWLFYTPPGDADFSKYRGLAPLSPDELDQWQQLLERRQARLARDHIPYLLVIVPDKQTVYPEFMPANLKKVGEESRLDEILDRLRDSHSPVRVLDLRPALLAAKKTAPVYLKHDTHWNDFGAYVGYRAIMEEIGKLTAGKRLPVLGPGDFVQGSVDLTNGDLVGVLGAPSLFDERVATMTPRVKVAIPTSPTEYIAEIDIDNDDARMPRLVMYRDSFATRLLPMMARSFSVGVYRWGYEFDGDLEKHKLDIVVNEFVERALDDPAWTDPPVIRQKGE
jgi:hypothetical protein